MKTPSCILAVVVVAVSVLAMVCGEATTEPSPPIKNRFVVIHENPMGIEAMRSLWASSDHRDGIWLYADVMRWRSKHAEELWSFRCGPTRGHWPFCGAGYDAGIDASDPAVTEPSPNFGKFYERSKKSPVDHAKKGTVPVAVGFGIDTHVLGDENEKQTPIEFLVDHKPPTKFVVLVPGSPTREALRRLDHGALPETGDDRPGRAAATAHAMVTREMVAPRFAKNRHRMYCHVEESGRILAHIIQKMERTKERLGEIVAHLRDEKQSVLVVNTDHLMDHPLRTMGKIRAFLTKTGPVTIEPIPEGSVESAREHIEPRDHVLQDCKVALESAKIRFAVGGENGDLVADIDKVLLRVVAVEEGRALFEREEEEEQKAAPPTDSDPQPTPAAVVVDDDKPVNPKVKHKKTMAEVAKQARQTRNRHNQAKRANAEHARMQATYQSKKAQRRRWRGQEPAMGDAGAIPDYKTWEP